MSPVGSQDFEKGILPKPNCPECGCGYVRDRRRDFHLNKLHGYRLCTCGRCGCEFVHYLEDGNVLIEKVGRTVAEAD